MADGDLTISAAEANRQFSKLLRAARDGRRVTITSHGEPVAELGPVRPEARIERRRAAHQALMRHLEAVEPVTIQPWTRDELYDRD
jgi:prevent-host-death family protein